MGYVDLAECPHYGAGKGLVASTGGADATQSTDAPTGDGSTQRLPWTGRAFGLADLALASSRGPARLVGLIGPFDAGKTSLLTAMFAHFASTGRVGDFDFAGSYTLSGWSQLRDHTVWPSPHSGSFPPHTPDHGGRVPSLLHLAFREDGGPLRDVLFTDAPGEWFTRWVKNKDAGDAEGARWIAEHASHFLFVVDRSGLAGENVGRVRYNTLALGRVLGEQLRGRPVVAVWTKSDKTCDEQIENPIRSRLNDFFGPHVSCDLSVEDPACAGLFEAFLVDPTGQIRREHETSGESPFLAYRGRFS